MGKPEKKRTDSSSSSSSSYVLRCFGVSRKIHSDKRTVDAGQEKKKKTRTRSWFRLKEDEITLTPIYETSEKQNSIVKDDKQNLFSVVRHVTDRKYIATSGYKKVDHERNQIDTNEQRDINPDPLSDSGYHMSHEQVCGGKLDPIKAVGPGLKPRVLREKSSRVRKESRVGNFDPVIGISIIMLTLLIMLMWGRVCAILCTSVWCYFLPRFKEAATAVAVAKLKRSGGDKTESRLFPGDLDLSSEAYKKKVVLEGFLVRQHRVTL
ncbi:PREDICTED: uncharacterized protein At5g23160-like [Camelina sativa]|uniref:Uncharacterized protein At5g23160-like n=1 Tax=Camelina sativa TaxID=90675 RepID=A0ABM0Y007_CAMSA|nr:PREDICTED: uncharacterized protein At5g23160-like [Camelina sativa]